MKPAPLSPPLMRRMAPLALIAGLLVGVVLPAVYQRVSLQERIGQAQIWAREVATRLEATATNRPRLWAYDRPALAAIARPVTRGALGGQVRIDTVRADRVFVSGRPRAGEVAGWAPIEVGGQLIGRVEVRLTAESIRNRTVLLWVSANVIAFLLAAGLFLIPLAAARHADEDNATLWQRLEDANATLEARVAERTAALRELGARLVAVQEEERARISRDLHDDVGQTMTALRLRLTTLDATLPADEPAREHVEIALAAVDAGVEQIRRLAHNLRPAALDGLGLAAALRAHALDWADAADIEIHLNLADVEPPAAITDVLFRLAQEGLTNIARHAQANTVWLGFGEADDGWQLTVEDDGRGLDPSRPKSSGGLGLVGARERVEQAGGYLDVTDREGGGVILLAWLPPD
ncbi:MAG: signal transduction histidine kinase [Bradymonadia bacterium]|jgi:signal transduction histidine kinase